MNAVAALLAFLAAAAQPQPFLHDREDDLLDFSYGWPAVVEEEPALRALLAREMGTAEAQARQAAQEDRAARQASDASFHSHSYSKVWQLAGSTPQLLSLTTHNETYTGGAHGNLTLLAVLWDRAADRQLDAATLFGEAALDRLTPLYCARLDAMRAERRGEPVRSDGDDPFTACPPLDRHALAPADEDGDGRFETLEVLLPPYEAGPWVEGPYVVELPLGPDDVAGLPEVYRMAFEPADSASLQAGERG